ncbi:MAG: hypothetical protein AABW56_04000 [Nanoarchaeota archaeon]
MLELESKDISIRQIGNIIYNNIVATPFSIARGLLWIYCLPSHINYGDKMKKYNFVEEVGGQFPLLGVDEERMNSQPKKKKIFEGHYYGRILDLREKLMKIESIEEAVLTLIPQHFVSFLTGILVAGTTVRATHDYGAKALIPIMITTGLSLIHESKFNKKLKNLESCL